MNYRIALFLMSLVTCSSATAWANSGDISFRQRAIDRVLSASTARSKPQAQFFTDGRGIRSLRSVAIPTSGATPGQRAINFVSRHGEAFDVLPADQLSVASSIALTHGSVVRLRQHSGQYPVIGASFIVRLDESGTVIAAFCDLIHTDVAALPVVSPAEASALALGVPVGEGMRKPDAPRCCR